MAAPDTLDKSIDRSLDDFGRFVRRKWLWLILGGLFAWWAIVNGLPQLTQLTPGSLLGFIVQMGLLIFVVIAQFIAIFWFIGRPRVYWVMPGETGYSFDDYKGNPEVLEAARRIVILLRGVKGFREMGGEISRGLLLVGPPGTGKSYLAQCISTEAGVPFGYASAASFRGMFWGMDVMIVKSLYRKARRYAREHGGCILFVDEFDAIGMSRSSQGNTMGMGGGMMGMMGGGSGGLNELLMQMDPPPLSESWWKNLLRMVGMYRGKNQREPVLTIGATNLPDSLDPALLRPGRFDRKIMVAPPTDAHRGEVIEYYLDKVKHDPIDLNKLVSDMMGYTPVAIKHVINEAVVLAHFDGRHSITYRDLSDARETHEFGIRYPRSLSMLEKRRLAYHEAGHAVAHVKLTPRFRVTRATITKRLGSNGEAYVAFKPTEEIVTQSADEVFAELQTLLASRAAEELFLETRLNGVGGDLHRATELALHYVSHWGMGSTFFSAPATLAPSDIYTDPGLRREVEDLLRQAYTTVKALLEAHHAAVIAVAEALLVKEELDSDEILTLIARAEAPIYSEIAANALAGVPAGTAPIATPAANGHAAAPAPSSVAVADPSRIVEGQLAPVPAPGTTPAEAPGPAPAAPPPAPAPAPSASGSAPAASQPYEYGI
ncbi:MAG TPA: AAA family ATPase [Ktedonobacterales bacterium]|nr:AAA family ATPase [Ktedonobacterales bacterium]